MELGGDRLEERLGQSIPERRAHQHGTRASHQGTGTHRLSNPGCADVLAESPDQTRVGRTAIRSASARAAFLIDAFFEAGLGVRDLCAPSGGIHEGMGRLSSLDPLEFSREEALRMAGELNIRRWFRFETRDRASSILDDGRMTRVVE